MNDKKPDIFDLGFDRNLNRIDTQRDYEIQTRNRFDEQRKEHESQERIRIQRVATSGKGPLLYTLDTIIEKCLMHSQNEINFFNLGFSGDMAGVAEAKKLFRLLKMEKCFKDFELIHTSTRIVFSIQEPDIDQLKKYKAKIQDVYFPKEKQIEETNIKETFEINVKDREVWINNYLLSKPHAVGTNLEFFSFVREHPANTPIKKSNLPDWLKEQIGNKGFSKILNEIGFKGEILKAFFPKRSKKGLIAYRGDKITKKNLEESGINIKLFLMQLELAHLKNNPK